MSKAHTLPFFGVGFVIAFVCSLLAIHFFLKLMAKVKLVPFAIYRLLVAAILLAVFFLSKRASSASSLL